MKSPTVAELAALLQEQQTEMLILRTAIDVQFHRIAEMQAELDVLPQARKRRNVMGALLAKRHNGNGHRAGLFAQIEQSNRLTPGNDSRRARKHSTR